MGIIKNERELTEPVDLALPNGRLNPAAVGWTRKPLHNANLKGWGRNKRFEYWCITAPDFFLALNLANADYAVVLANFFLDRNTCENFAEGERHFLRPWRQNPMPKRTGQDSLVGVGDTMHMEFLDVPGGTLLKARTPRMEVEIMVQEAPDHESLGVVVPWDDKRFQYTRKDNCMPASGRVRIDGKVRDFESGYATLDHGRGRWPYQILWNWASGSGISQGREIGLQMGAKWTDGTPSTENALRIDGRIEKISQDLDWVYDTSDYMKPWKIGGDRVDLVFTPIHDRVSKFNMIVFAAEEHQCFGRFDGTVISENGETIAVENVPGWAEQVFRRW